VTDVTVRNDSIGADQIEIIDLRAKNKLVDVNHPGQLERIVFEFVLADLKVGVSVDLIAFDNII
jgi:hypothetical protein